MFPHLCCFFSVLVSFDFLFLICVGIFLVVIVRLSLPKMLRRTDDEAAAAVLLWRMKATIVSKELDTQSKNEENKEDGGRPVKEIAIPNVPFSHSALTMPSGETTFDSSSLSPKMRPRTVSVGSMLDVEPLPSISNPSLALSDPALKLPTLPLLSTTKQEGIVLEHYDWRNYTPGQELSKPESPDGPKSFRPVQAFKKVNRVSPASVPTTKWKSFVGQTANPNVPFRSTLRRKFNWKQYPEVNPSIHDPSVNVEI